MNKRKFWLNKYGEIVGKRTLFVFYKGLHFEITIFQTLFQLPPLCVFPRKLNYFALQIK